MSGWGYDFGGYDPDAFDRWLTTDPENQPEQPEEYVSESDEPESDEPEHE